MRCCRVLLWLLSLLFCGATDVISFLMGLFSNIFILPLLDDWLFSFFCVFWGVYGNYIEGESYYFLVVVGMANGSYESWLFGCFLFGDYWKEYNLTGCLTIFDLANEFPTSLIGDCVCCICTLYDSPLESSISSLLIFERLLGDI